LLWSEEEILPSSAYIYIYILPYRYSETRNHLYGEPAGRAEESHRGTPPTVAGAAGASVPEDKKLDDNVYVISRTVALTDIPIIPTIVVV
jgi:hypothetical protein